MENTTQQLTEAQIQKMLHSLKTSPLLQKKLADAKAMCATYMNKMENETGVLAKQS